MIFLKVSLIFIFVDFNSPILHLPSHFNFMSYIMVHFSQTLQRKKIRLLIRFFKMTAKRCSLKYFFFFKGGRGAGCNRKSSKEKCLPLTRSLKSDVKFMGKTWQLSTLFVFLHLHKDCFPLKGCLVSGSVCTGEN